MSQIAVFTGILSIFLMFSSFGVEAASAFKKALDQKTNKYIDKGTVIGGEAGQAFSLLKVRSQVNSKKKIERVVLNLGDKDGNILSGEPSFFQVNVEPKRSRIIISLSQVLKSRVSEAELGKVFKNSPFVKSVKIVSDPEGAMTNLVLKLKTPVKAEVFQMAEKGKPGRIVLDLIRR